jgi:hypothetical protein
MPACVCRRGPSRELFLGQNCVRLEHGFPGACTALRPRLPNRKITGRNQSSVSNNFRHGQCLDPKKKARGVAFGTNQSHLDEGHLEMGYLEGCDNVTWWRSSPSWINSAV